MCKTGTPRGGAKARSGEEEKRLNYESTEGAEEEAAITAQSEYMYALTHSSPQPKPRPAAPGYCGVSASGKRRWAANIYFGGKRRSLGTFDTKQEAALAYDRDVRQCGEEEKRLNY